MKNEQMCATMVKLFKMEISTLKKMVLFLLLMLLFAKQAVCCGIGKYGLCGNYDTLVKNAGYKCEVPYKYVKTPTEGHCTFECYYGHYMTGASHIPCHPETGWKYPAPTCTPYKCSSFSIDKGRYNCTNDNVYASECNIYCYEGYELSDQYNTKVRCNANREWSPAIPTCKAKICPNYFTTLSDGHASCSNANYFGSVCNYTCNDMFVLNGRSKIVCSVDTNSHAKWDAEYKPKCERKLCPIDNTFLENGFATCTESIRNKLNSVCTFKCDLGFYQKGANETTCALTGQWTQQKPTCEDVKCPTDSLNLLHGHVVCHGSKHKNAYNSICKYECNPGYVLKGSNTSICNSDHKWNTTAPLCEVVTCNQPKDVNGGIFRCLNFSYEYKSTCDLVCSKGYTINGISKITCGGNAIWTYEGFCQSQPCSMDFLHLRNGEVKCNGNDTLSIYGTTCNFTCDSGYILKGDTTLTCTENGQWSGAKQTCEERYCTENFTTIVNGNTHCTGAKEKHQYGSICSFSCEVGYQLSQNIPIRCKSNGEWSSRKPECLVIKCNQPEKVENGILTCNTSTYDFQSMCDLDCHVGYKLNGESTQICSLTGSWSKLGSCKAISCAQSNTIIENGYATCDNGHSYGSLCNVSCLRGYVLNGSKSLTCNSDGKWNNEKPHCEEPQCPVSEIEVMNGESTCSGAKDKNGYNSTCIFKCNPGYELHGNPFITCNLNKTWSSLKPDCIAITCSQPVLVPGGDWLCNVSSYTFKTTCQLICYKGYRLLGNRNITCSENKQWSPYGACSDEEPPYFPNGCPNDINATTDLLKNYSIVSYETPKYYDNSGDTSLIVSQTPNSGAKFNIGRTEVNITIADKAGNVGYCIFTVTIEESTCGIPDIDSSKEKLIEYDCKDEYIYGATCILKCSNGKPVLGSKTITCSLDQNSKRFYWKQDQNTQPHCNAKSCPSLEPPENGLLSCNSISHDTQFCVVLCDDNFSVSKDVKSTTFICTNTGEWTSGSDKIPKMCLRKHRIRRGETRLAFYYKSGQCHEDSEDIKTIILDIISKNKVICNEKCKQPNVNIQCYDASKTGRKKRDLNAFEYKITATIDLGDYVENGSPAETFQFYDEMVAEMNEQFEMQVESGVFDIPAIGVFTEMDYGEVIFVCSAGQSINYETMACTGCGLGFFFNNHTESCGICQKGSYQDQEIAFACISCPNGTTTEMEGATSASDCRDMCNMGETSESGNQPCESCPIGTYQPDKGRKRCIRCPFGMSTQHPRQTSIKSCYFLGLYLKDGQTSPIIQVYNDDPEEFTFMTWIYNTNISFENVIDDTARLVVDSINIFLSPSLHSVGKKTRQWNHVALIYSRQNATLYLNGQEMKYITDVNISLLNSRAIRFESSMVIPEIMVSGIQLTTTRYSKREIEAFSLSCLNQVDNHFLAQDLFAETTLNNNSCNDGCGKGYYYDKSSGLCILCPKGFYQDQDISFACKKCPKGSTDQGIQSTSIEFCHDPCGDGVVFDIKTKKCQKCSKGYFKDTEYECRKCPEGKTTRAAKSTSILDCHDMCEPGHYSTTGKIPCNPCPIGSYQPYYQQTTCFYCAFGKSTWSVGKKENYHCEYVDMILNDTHGLPKINASELNPKSFSLMMRISSISNVSFLSMSSFSIQKDSDSFEYAYISVEELHIAVKPAKIKTKNQQNFRKWIHIALLYNEGTVTLLVNGSIIDSSQVNHISKLNVSSIQFKGTSNIKSLMITHMQLSKTAYSSSEIIEHVSDCRADIDENLLYTDSNQSTLLHQSTCKEDNAYTTDFDFMFESEDYNDSSITENVFNNKSNEEKGNTLQHIENLDLVTMNKTEKQYILDKNISLNETEFTYNRSLQAAEVEALNVLNKTGITYTLEESLNANASENNLKLLTGRQINDAPNDTKENDRYIKLNENCTNTNSIKETELLSEDHLLEHAEKMLPKVIDLQLIFSLALPCNESIEEILTYEYIKSYLQTLRCEKKHVCTHYFSTNDSCREQESLGIFLNLVMNISLQNKEESFELENIMNNIFTKPKKTIVGKFENRNFTLVMDILGYSGECDEGETFKFGWCYKCPAGSSSYNNGPCTLCRKGYYQTQEGASECVPCPDDLTTYKEGSVSEMECKKQISPSMIDVDF